MWCVVARQKIEIQKQKITENISNSTTFWKEPRKPNPTSKTISNNIDDTNGPKEICNLFYEKYRAFITAFRLLRMNLMILIIL